MSLILEALRKSEAERRRGQVPDLHASPASDVPTARNGPPAWMWMVLGLAGVLVVAAAIWLGLGLQGGAADRDAPAPAVVDAVDPTRGNRQTDVAPAGPVRPARSTAPLARPEQTPEPPAQAPARNAESTASSATERQLPASASPPVLSVAPEPQTPPIEPAAVVPPPLASTSRRKSPAVVADDPSRERGAAGTATPTQPAAPAPAAVAAAPASSLPPMRLSDLPVSQRELLPPLRMSMHLWAPTQRFAIIDGARVSEGDRVGDAVVEAITSDGVTLAWQGKRLHLPVR
ncbi:MAG: general secretion pathway protein GspB [Pseudomonadota bacterium]|nr:general secretion pathway protein GspB [Pseudomonadota bacterium]